MCAKSCPTLCDPMDCNLPGSSVHGIFQAKILEWVAISYSRGSSPPRNLTQVSCIAGMILYYLSWPPGKPSVFTIAYLDPKAPRKTLSYVDGCQIIDIHRGYILLDTSLKSLQFCVFLYMASENIQAYFYFPNIPYCFNIIYRKLDPFCN